VRDLPPYSIAVGLPQKINYAFNTRRCNIVGVWSGELLNIGPNVEGRGKDASLILGDWLFNSQDMLVINDAKQCQYRKFVNGPSPAFHFTLDNVEYRLTTEKHSAKGLTFVYQVLANPDNRSQKITLPLKPQLQVSSSGGKTLDGLMQVESNVSRFTINIVKE
jgi:hypothetical protein